MTEKAVILGSTGSIGTQALEVCDSVGTIRVLGLSANKNIGILEDQIRKYNPKLAVVMNEDKARALKENVKDTNTKVLCGMEGLIELASFDEADTVLNSLVGNVGLRPTIAAIESGKTLALANKETLVTSGELVMRLVKEKGINLYPVDSEHSAIFQCLQGNKGNKIKKIHLTASGGPFRGYKSLKDVTLEQALHHPNWDMGKKVTIDSATMMNKGLEVIEAKWLFDVDVDQINVVVHPQSIIHSMVEFEDSAVMAQLGEPDMRLPISYALTYPKRVKNDFPKVDFFEIKNLTFEKPDLKVFKCLAMALTAIKTGGTMPAVLNAANEVAVSRFLKRDIKFFEIGELIEKVINAYTVKYDYTLEDVFEADNWAREYARSLEV
ncbi:MAG: 1-deoxy-D-xylulose-5-phosphate reductoisomerase [Clostridiales bacterium]|nr:1-deoxy-D-xylulose-5-phosphate reductoisomerase [Clostridiales bacterium]